MRPFHSTGPRMLTIVAALVTLAVTSLSASTVLQFNLAEMSRRAQKIYVGTVRSASEGTLAVGGGQLAVVTYVLTVDEDLLGETAMVKGERVAEIRMLGRQKVVQVGNLQSVSPVPDMPVLTLGQPYLVFTTQPSGVGLSTTVGLGQGASASRRSARSEHGRQRGQQQRAVPRTCRPRRPRGRRARRSAAAERRTDPVRRSGRAASATSSAPVRRVDHDTSSLRSLRARPRRLPPRPRVHADAGGPLVLVAPGSRSCGPTAAR